MTRKMEKKEFETRVKVEVSNSEMMTKAINHAEKMVSVCNKQIEYLTHPETYGCCLSKCNSIVINKERMMTVTTDDNHMTTYEFSPLYPTYFSPETAREIVEHDIYKGINDQPIKLEIVGKLEYYQLLKVWAEDHLRVMKSVIC